jgi:phage gp45-like
MHAATPAHTSFRAYVGGGARSVIHEADDSKFMQEMAGGFMKGETRGGVESPQNYGFTSVVHDADKGDDGEVSDGAEGFVSFMGGNRSFPVCGVMDDRRHRLWGCEKGDTAMYRGKDDGQQLHMTKDGGFWSAQTDKTVRMHLVDQQQQQQQQGGGGATRDAGSGSSGGQDGQQQGGQQKGQKPNYKDGLKSYRFVDVTKDATRLSGNESHMMLSDGDSYVHCTDKKAYLGGNSGKHQFAKVLTTAGPASNVFGRIDGGLMELELAPGVFQQKATPGVFASARPALVPALMLLLGLSLGVNYALITARAPIMLASLTGR